MADVTITQLTSIGAGLDSADEVPVWDVSGAVSRKTTVAQIVSDRAQYASGVWTPSLQINSITPVGMTYSSQIGQWVRTGSQVFVEGRIFLTAKGSTTGPVKITGLPYSVAIVNGAAATLAWNLAAGTPTIGLLQAMTAGVDITLYASALAASLVALNETHLTNTTSIYFAASYYTLASF